MNINKTYKHGSYIIHNVPYSPYPRGIGPNGEKEYIDGSVMYKLTFILKDMQEKEILLVDYRDYHND